VTPAARTAAGRAIGACRHLTRRNEFDARRAAARAKASGGIMVLSAAAEHRPAAWPPGEISPAAASANSTVARIARAAVA